MASAVTPVARIRPTATSASSLESTVAQSSAGPLSATLVFQSLPNSGCRQLRRVRPSVAVRSSPNDNAERSSGASMTDKVRRAGPIRNAAASPDDEVDAVTRKWGLEAGLWKALTAKKNSTNESTSAATPPSSSSSSSEGERTGDQQQQQHHQQKSNTEVAKDLLTRYGGAYLASSICLSLVSFSLCYLMVGQGVDVAGLLDKFGLSVDATGEVVGTFAIAYATHKALSPFRFPPTVALTPIVASWLGKDKEEGQSK